MKICLNLSSNDVDLQNDLLDGFVPANVFDFHAHLFSPACFTAPELPPLFKTVSEWDIAAYRASMSRRLPERSVNGLFFGFPAAGVDRSRTNEWIDGELISHPELKNSRALALVSPQDGAEKVKDWIAKNHFAGLKPYHIYADQKDTMEAEIEAYAPAWMWEICHEIGGVLMLHIVRRKGITDAENIAALRRLCRRYPNCRVVLAHIARSFNYRHARAGLEAVKELQNIFVDTSLVTEAEAMRHAIRTLGPERVLYGSDSPVSELRGKCCSIGDGFAWIYADQLPKEGISRIGEFTLLGIESLLCLKEACRDCELSSAEIAAVFHDNALRLFSV
jgi:glutamate-1-semialdehyde 2,1-aminomutase